MPSQLVQVKPGPGKGYANGSDWCRPILNFFDSFHCLVMGCLCHRSSCKSSLAPANGMLIGLVSADLLPEQLSLVSNGTICAIAACASQAWTQLRCGAE